jgi:hypothetical protein
MRPFGNPKAEKKKELEETQIKLRPDEMEVIINIAVDLLNGHDPRQLLGIKATRGPRIRNEHRHWEMDIATYFWALRMQATPMRAKAAGNEVSSVSGASPQRVEKIARKRKQFAKSMIEGNLHFDFLSISKLCLTGRPTK